MEGVEGLPPPKGSLEILGVQLCSFSEVTSGLIIAFFFFFLPPIAFLSLENVD